MWSYWTNTSSCIGPMRSYSDTIASEIIRLFKKNFTSNAQTSK